MKSEDRVLGWDLLRGLCALLVAAYHLMYWQDIAAVHAFGSYGVYLFFILSGASLAYTYAKSFELKSFSYRRFLWARYLRLAPLYVALMVLALPWKLTQSGPSVELLTIYLTNATFLFGFYNPAAHAVLVGGWSLGIEVIFYLLFPLFMLSLQHRPKAICLVLVVVLVQVAWVCMTVAQPDGYEKNFLRYFQAPAFAAYFVLGCIIGSIKLKNASQLQLSSISGLSILLSGFAALFLMSPEKAGDELIGWRGLASASLCLFMVYIASKISPEKLFKYVAQKFGDSTYGVYLLHPVIFFGSKLIVFPLLGVPDPVNWQLFNRCLFAFFVIAVSAVLALGSEKYFEKPLRSLLKSKI